MPIRLWNKNRYLSSILRLTLRRKDLTRSQVWIRGCVHSAPVVLEYRDGRFVSLQHAFKTSLVLSFSLSLQLLMSDHQDIQNIEFEYYQGPNASPPVDRRRSQFQAPPVSAERAYQCLQCTQSFDRPSALDQVSSTYRVYYGTACLIVSWF